MLMHIPSLQPVSSSHYCVSGDVMIHPTATIAAGVLLQADPGSKVVVGAGVCLGMGTVLHAHEGTLEIESEATIGAGVLIVGSSKVGANACIGSASTLWNYSIDRGMIIPPLSLLGAVNRSLSKTESAHTATPVSAPVSSLVAPQETLNGSTAEPASKQPTAEIQLSVTTPVYGQASLNRLLSTLLPHRQMFARDEQNGEGVKDEG